MVSRGFIGKLDGKESVLSCRFNQDSSCLALATTRGFHIYQCEPFRKCFERLDGAIGCAEMLFQTSLIALVGDGQNPKFSARSLRLMDWRTGDDICELSFLFGIAAVRLNRSRLVVVLPGEVQVFALKDVSRLETYASLNPRGVCGMSDTGLVAFPTETTGVVRVIDTEQRHVVADIAAHRTALVAISISSDGKKLATASERGTVIRAYQLPIGTQLATFRRGTLPVTISSLSFNHPPTQLCSSSDSDTIHIFSFRESAAEDDDVHAPVSRGSGAAADRNSVSDIIQSSQNVAEAVMPFSVTEMLSTERCETFVKLVSEKPQLTISALDPDGKRLNIVTADGIFRAFRLTDPVVTEPSPAYGLATAENGVAPAAAVASAVWKPVWTKCNESILI